MVFMEDVPSAPSPVRTLFIKFWDHPTLFLPVIVLIAVIVRIIFLPNPGFEADISFWKSWGLAVYDHNIVWSIQNTNNNYPTAFAYVLGAMAWIYSLFADPHNFREFWSNTNLIFLTIAKLPSVFADAGIFTIILWFGKRASKYGFPQVPYALYVLAASAFLLNPITIIDGAWWGQVDSVGVFMYLLAFIFAIKRKPYLAGLIYMASMMTKLQNMIYGPVFFILLWQLCGLKGLIKGAAGAITGFIGFNFEFFLARQMKLVFESLTVNYDYFPFMSLNAYNLWWIVAKANGMKMLDKFSMIGIANAKTIGLFMFSSFYLLAVLVMVKDTLISMGNKTHKDLLPMDLSPTIYRFFTALIIVACAFFLFQTESHDRYAFPIVVYLPLWLIFFLATSLTKMQRPRLFETPQFIRCVAAYGAFTLVYFYNLHTAMVANYPLNGLPILKELTHPVTTITASVIHLVLFALFLYTSSKHFSRTLFVVPVVTVIFGILLINKSLITKSPISLTALSPIISQQGYGKRQTNMPVNSGGGFNVWSPLSVQYYFYKKGIGTHAKSYHQYHINGQFKTFTTDIGIDTEAGSKGTATFEIYGDDRPLYNSGKIGRFDLPKHVEVDVTGVKLLGIVTNDADDGISDDHTDWLNPQLWP